MSNRVLVWCATAFALASAVVFAIHIAGYAVIFPSIYHFVSIPVGSSTTQFALDSATVVNFVVVLLLSAILFFGYFAPISAAYLGCQIASLFLSGRLSPGQYLVVLPGLCAVACGASIGQGIADDFNHKGNIYTHIKAGLLLFGLTIILTAGFIYFSPAIASMG
jgi:hypothetical protein